MGLNLNTPQVRNYTGLNPVRSGSTTQSDNNVKYVSQDLTEEQQAQARQNIGAGEPQVQADWTQTDTEAVDYIKNKPTIPAAQIQSDWNETDTESPAYIQNKPTIPAAQIQSDWNQADTEALDYIKNKPTIVDFEQYNTVTFNLPETGQVWFRKGQHSNYNNITIYIDGQYEGTFTPTEEWTSTNTYAAGRHVMKYKTDNNIGGIMSEGPSNTDDLAGASNFIEYVSMYCPTILGNGANFGGNTAVVVPYPGQDVPDTGGHGEGEGVRHLVQTSVINNTVQIENYYVLSETPATKNVTTFYVPQGTGAAWLALNPGKTVYEYIDLTYPPLGTVVVRSSGYSRVNPQYAAAIPVAVLYNPVPLTMTDANGTVISGDFVAQNVTITPVV